MTQKKSARKQMPVRRGSGNVFADLGLPDPEEHLAKAELALAISRAINERGLTQQAAALMEIDQPKVSHILRGRLTDFSTERLMNLLMKLGRDVETVVRPAPKSRTKGRLSVSARGKRMRGRGAKLSVVRLVAAQGAWPAIFGLVAGLAGSIAATRVMQSVIGGVGVDGPVLGAVTVALGIVVALAGYLPARQASRIDPARVLRAE